MDLLQIALIFLIALLSIFLAITGFQVFLILKDLKKALDRLNKLLKTSEEITKDVEKPVVAATNLMAALTQGAQTLMHADKKEKAQLARPKRFYKKIL